MRADNSLQNLSLLELALSSIHSIPELLVAAMMSRQQQGVQTESLELHLWNVSFLGYKFS